MAPASRSPKKSVLRKLSAGSKPLAKTTNRRIASNSHVPSNHRLPSRTHSSSATARRATSQSAPRANEEEKEKAEPSQFPGILNKKSGPAPLGRWDFTLAPNSAKWNEILTSFKEALQERSLQEVLNHVFTDYEKYLMLPTSDARSEVLKNIRKNSSERYGQLLEGKFRGVRSCLGVKLTLLYLGHPVAPLSTANMVASDMEYRDAHGPYPGDIPDNRDMSEFRRPLQFLSGHAKRLHGRRDPIEETWEPAVNRILRQEGQDAEQPMLGLRGGGGDADENEDLGGMGAEDVSGNDDEGETEIVGLRRGVGRPLNFSAGTLNTSAEYQRGPPKPVFPDGRYIPGQIPTESQFRNGEAWVGEGVPYQSANAQGGDLAGLCLPTRPLSTQWPPNTPTVGEGLCRGGLRAPLATPEGVYGPKSMSDTELNMRMREMSYWRAPTMFHNNMTPKIPINAPPVDPVLKSGGPSVPTVSVGMQTPTEQFRMQRAVYLLRNIALDRARQCPFDTCFAEFNMADDVELCKHIQEHHFPAECPFCDEPLYTYWSKAQREEHILSKHRTEILRERVKDLQETSNAIMTKKKRRDMRSKLAAAAAAAARQGVGDMAATDDLTPPMRTGETGAPTTSARSASTVNARGKHCAGKNLPVSISGGGRTRPGPAFYQIDRSKPEEQDRSQEQGHHGDSRQGLAPSSPHLTIAFRPGQGNVRAWFCHRCGSSRFIFQDEMDFHISRCSHDKAHESVCGGCCGPIFGDERHACPSIKNPAGPLSCRLCGFTSRTEDHKQIHMSKCRGINGRPFTYCPCCGVKVDATSAAELNAHQKNSQCSKRVGKWEVLYEDQQTFHLPEGTVIISSDSPVENANMEIVSSTGSAFPPGMPCATGSATMTFDKEPRITNNSEGRFIDRDGDYIYCKKAMTEYGRRLEARHKTTYDNFASTVQALEAQLRNLGHQPSISLSVAQSSGRTSNKRWSGNKSQRRRGQEEEDTVMEDIVFTKKPTSKIPPEAHLKKVQAVGRETSEVQHHLVPRSRRSRRPDSPSGFDETPRTRSRTPRRSARIASSTTNSPSKTPLAVTPPSHVSRGPGSAPGSAAKSARAEPTSDSEI
ncbi:hypothetical protein MKZ38_003903 [Zalerion maritima]|uniref:Uncharacterized protein n=1 Tax=Zalerion maritima TaxID=339359 RepID=A0AAD5WX05_9PEZI|nr:hypothetical protein MKZ38_003903 [Zalerion maritima]